MVLDDKMTGIPRFLGCTELYGGTQNNYCCTDFLPSKYGES